jgi:hypothetical protein
MQMPQKKHELSFSNSNSAIFLRIYNTNSLYDLVPSGIMWRHRKVPEIYRGGDGQKRIVESQGLVSPDYYCNKSKESVPFPSPAVFDSQLYPHFHSAVFNLGSATRIFLNKVHRFGSVILRWYGISSFLHFKHLCLPPKSSSPDP